MTMALIFNKITELCYVHLYLGTIIMVFLYHFSERFQDPVADGALAVLCSTHHVRIFDAERLVRTSTIDGEYFMDFRLPMSCLPPAHMESGAVCFVDFWVFYF